MDFAFALLAVPAELNLMPPLCPQLRFANDVRRPQFHLLPPANWMNDPNAPVYWNGHYHMFYQYNPNGAVWGDMHWGHALSPDMVHWQHLPSALAPSPGGPDADGCFSGSAAVEGDRVMVLYTGVISVPASIATARDGVHNFKETQCLAIGSGKDLLTWTKDPKPVIVAPPAGIEVTGFRDPSLWRQGDWWYMVLGSGTRSGGGAVLVYRSKDLRQWEYRHVLTGGKASHASAANPVDSGDMWECPDLFPLGDKTVLIYSSSGRVHWQCGDLDLKEWIFHPQHQGVVDYGASYYAAKTQLDGMKNRILWGWLPETRALEEYRAAGWAGMMSLPRLLTVDNDGWLRVQVAPAVEVLRQKAQTLELSENEEQNQHRIASMHIEQCSGEVLCTVKRGMAPLNLSLTNDNRRESWLAMRYEPSEPEKFFIEDQLLPLRTTSKEIEIRLYIDGSAIEAFVNRQIAFTRRFYYSGTKAPRVGLTISGKTTAISRLTLWQMSPISPDRLTG